MITGDILLSIVARKRQEVERLKATNNTRALQECAIQSREIIPRHRLRRALEAKSPRIKIIAEFKRQSPSRGVIRADLPVTAAVTHYEQGGACAISILTDETSFGGTIADLVAARAHTQLPILRKDFLIDPVQLYQSAIAGADAVLLIAAILDDRVLRQMRVIAEDELGLDAVVEVHNADELGRARQAGARVIGVNNRNLHTFEVSLSTSMRLIADAPSDALMISESGLQTSEQLRQLQLLGFHGFLVGESLMQAKDPATRLSDLMKCGQIKICGIRSLDDAKACAELGADMIGLNFWPGSPRTIKAEMARRIVQGLPSQTRPVAVFVDENPDTIRRIANLTGIESVQLHGETSPEVCRELSQEFRVIRAFQTNSSFEPKRVESFHDCDILLDAPHAKLRGGTGEVCDWSMARLALPFTRFLILSGGLNAENVGAALKEVRPHAVDVCSGVESAPGVKDPHAIESFIQAVRRAEGTLASVT